MHKQGSFLGPLHLPTSGRARCAVRSGQLSDHHSIRCRGAGSVSLPDVSVAQPSGGLHEQVKNETAEEGVALAMGAGPLGSVGWPAADGPRWMPCVTLHSLPCCKWRSNMYSTCLLISRENCFSISKFSLMLEGLSLSFASSEHAPFQESSLDFCLLPPCNERTIL